MNDSVVYTYEGVSISQSNFIANGKTNPLSSILWIEQRDLKPKRWPGRLLMFGGLPLLFGHANLPMFGSVLMLLGLLHWRTAAMRYAVVIRTKIGEHEALISENAQDIENVISALKVAKLLKVTWDS